MSPLRGRKKKRMLASSVYDGIATNNPFETFEINNESRKAIIDFLLFHGFERAHMSESRIKMLGEPETQPVIAVCYKNDHWGEAWIIGDSKAFWVFEEPHPYISFQLGQLSRAYRRRRRNPPR